MMIKAPRRSPSAIYYVHFIMAYIGLLCVSLQIEIWERGAGYTLASDSSSTVAAAVARRLGLCDSDITVHMPGGQIQIQFADDYSATMTGPVTKVCDGNIVDEMFEKSF